VDNGGVADGDGYRFRGRGLLQLTGRAMYKYVATVTALPLENHPEMAEHALEIAGGAWKYDKVDKLSENGSVEAYTQRINGGQTVVSDRKARFAKLIHVMNIDA
jgi:putative chitinase